MYKIVQDAEHHYTLYKDEVIIIGSSDKARLLRYCKAQGIQVEEYIPLPRRESSVWNPF